MTLDEAIQHAKDKAEEQRKDNDTCVVKEGYGCKDCAYYYSKPCIECAEEHEQLAEWLEELKEYKELEEQGLLLKLPCKIGSNVYAIATIYECKHDYLDCPMDFPDVYQCERNCKCEYEYKKLVVRPIIFKFEMLKDFNKKVFLTKEEAEQELKRLESSE